MEQPVKDNMAQRYGFNNIAPRLLSFYADDEEQRDEFLFWETRRFVLPLDDPQF